MIGLGTIINSLAVIVGSAVGIALKSGLKPRFQQILMQALGVCTMFIGLSGVLKGMFTVSGDVLETGGTMLLILSLIIGALVGEAINIEAKLEKLGGFIKSKIKLKNDEGTFVSGFVTASLVVCVGAMGVVGCLQDGLTRDISTLVAKSALDLVIVMIFASAMGIGTMFSAIPLFIYQMAITLLAGVISPVVTDTLISNLSLVGSALIFMIGINLAFGDMLKVKFKTGNMLPALLIPIVWEMVSKLAIN